MREFELRRMAYDRSMEVQREMNLEGWRQARLVAFMAVKPYMQNKNMSMYEFMELPGDKKAHVAFEQEADAAIQYWIEQGHLKPKAQA